MMNETIEGSVVETISSVLGSAEGAITIHTKMEEVKNWDSMHHVTIINRLEKQFGVSIPEEDVFDLDSVEAFANEIHKLKGV